ncbi:MAG: DMT family transporter [Candidatus Gottesmanbacteria bacterium]|nr:DMT family transporter [Candidatus Gottesmanbacteria bacterium]
MWLILSLMAVVMFTAQNLLMRVLAVKSVHPRTFSVVFNGWGTIFAAILFLIERPSLVNLPHISWIQWILIAAAVLGYGLYERTHFLARKELEASTIAILFRLTYVITFIGAILFLHEPLTITKLIGATILIGASLVVVHKNPKLQASRAVWIAIFAAVMLGIAGLLDKPASHGIPANLYSVALWGLSVLVVAFPSISLSQLKTEFIIGGWKVALTAFLNVIGFVFYVQALSLADASLVTPVTSSSGTLTVLAGIFILKEKSFIGRKILAGILMLIGILLLR